MASAKTSSNRSSNVPTKSDSTSAHQHVVWYFNREETSRDSWIPFADIDNQILEDAFQRNTKTIELDDGIVDFEKSIRIDKQNSSNRRSIKRSVRSPCEAPLRSERFHVSQKLAPSSNENNVHDHRFINEWRKRYKNMSTEEALEKAAEGISKEGALLGKEIEAQWIAQQLRAMKGQSNNEIDSCVISLYTQESFLYRLVNMTLRENDQSKLQTLGPFAQLLFHTDCSSSPGKKGYAGELYRGAQLDQQTIDSYQQSIGQVRTWDAFSSTSKNRKKAASYGNVLFIINRDPSTRYKFSGMDISAVSQYPDEEEVLIRAARNFTVQDVQKDDGTGKYTIHLLLH